MPATLTLTAESADSLVLSAEAATAANPSAESPAILTLSQAAASLAYDGQLYPDGDNAYPDHPNGFPSSEIPLTAGLTAETSTTLTLTAA